MTSGIVTSVALFLQLGIRIDHSCQVQMPVIKKSMYNFQFASSSLMLVSEHSKASYSSQF